MTSKERSGLYVLLLDNIDGDALWTNAELVDKAVCGGYDGTFRWEAEISTRKLDDNGFVVDNHEMIRRVQAIFDSGVFKASCEELAAGVAFMALAMCITRAYKIVTRVFNRTGHAEYVWEYGDADPVFPRKATRKEIATSEGPQRGC